MISMVKFICVQVLLIFFSSSASCAALDEQKQRVFFNDIQEEENEDEEMKGPRVTHALLGGHAVLECEAGGTPAPLIHWLRHGQRIDQDGVLNEIAVAEESLSHENTETNRHLPTLQLSATRSRLFIDCVSPEDAGIYVCVAETPTRRIAIKHLLKIETKKTSRVRMRLNKRHVSRNVLRGHNTKVGDGDICFRKHIEPEPVPARIYMWTLHRVELEGADVQLYCRPTGSGLVKVKWFDRNGEAIRKQDAQYQVLESGDLVVKSINWTKNMGLYRCIAENSYGTDAVEVFVYPAAKGRKHD